jgi:hypothetical protein
VQDAGPAEVRRLLWKVVDLRCDRLAESVVDHAEALGFVAARQDVMHGVGPTEDLETPDGIPGWNQGRGELRPAQRAGRCVTGPSADAVEVAACVLTDTAGEDVGTEVLSAYDALSWGFALRDMAASNRT